ncbi:hypothetical protein ABGB18_41025 [Nonomuraea sp. B12E4]|uniref:hypothetical protein n=1 Tax=Nonomuraea sp. B12E4 TaxID=3153564 RepID=UPI00325E21A3
MAFRNSGVVVVIVGVYGGLMDKFPDRLADEPVAGRPRRAAYHVQHYLQPLLGRIRRGELDPSFVISHRLPLREAPQVPIVQEQAGRVQQRREPPGGGPAA